MRVITPDSTNISAHHQEPTLLATTTTTTTTIVPRRGKSRRVAASISGPRWRILLLIIMFVLGASLCSGRGFCDALRTTGALQQVRSRFVSPQSRTNHWFGSGTRRVFDHNHHNCHSPTQQYHHHLITSSNIYRGLEGSIFRCYSSRSNQDPDTRRGEGKRRRGGQYSNSNSNSSSSSNQYSQRGEPGNASGDNQRRRRNTGRDSQNGRYNKSDNYDSNQESYGDYNYDYDDPGFRNQNNRNRQRGPSRERSQVQSQPPREPRQLGRNRYSPDGQKKQDRRSSRGSPSDRRGGRGRGASSEQSRHQLRERPPLPSLDSHPTYFTCRHTYESALRQELQRSIDASYRSGGNPHGIPSNYQQLVSISNPHPGLVVITIRDENENENENKALAALLSTLRPTYALQQLPDCAVVRAESIKGLATAVLEKITDEETGLLPAALVAAPRGSLAIHVLVPEMGRGMPESNLPQYRRANRIGAEVASQLRKRCQAARNPRSTDADADDDPEPQDDRWLLQVLLLEPEVVVASLSRCDGTKQSGPTWTWPNWKLPAGLALVDLDKSTDSMVPSSAYRKLLESFWYLGDRPPPSLDQFPVIDLGACPGGWTGALRQMGCEVVAVDRSPLAPGLMKDRGVEYVQGDAFRFVPPWARSDPNDNNDWPGKTLSEPLPNTWMVSDIIAYPDKIAELLDHWCGNLWVSHAIVTVKFQAEIPWDELESIRAMVRGHGYHCRTVHFFNNKNEVTLLAVHDGYSSSSSSSSSLLGKPMYSPIMPAPTTKKQQ
eukprot:jgi/Psemu1/18819/gm1.18819_g